MNKESVITMGPNQSNIKRLPRQPEPHQRQWNGRCVDKYLKEEWLIALNSFKTLKTVSICQGHVNRANDLCCPHINIRIKPEYVVELKRAIDNPNTVIRSAGFPKGTLWDYAYSEETSNLQLNITYETAFRFIRSEKQTSELMDSSTVTWFEQMILSLLVLDQIFTEVIQETNKEK